MSLLLRIAAFASLVALSSGTAACAAPASDEETGESEAPLTLSPAEIVGEIQFGDNVTVDYTGETRYRAYWFNGQKGDWMNVTVDSSTGEIIAFLADNQFRQVPRGMAMALRKTGKYYVVVREGQLRPATLTIHFNKHPLPSSSSSRAPTSTAE